ncbi:hypothetical protein BOTCAL_0075g00270 [Botryotinia calthae]|uniref:DEAD/DEAH-box helicase domain-containing protein n=1 Tax=Botryotinia calthae TaxID=38488 RepID=A0A4Y8DB09_9HELO|nr:hypothetical protein BOTCAL_0075g00270 [Botryotinia calthae]
MLLKCKGADQYTKCAKARRTKNRPVAVSTVFIGLNECMKRIHEIELMEMLEMIREGSVEEYIEKQEELIGLCLERILWFLDKTVIRKPKPMQTQILRRLIYGKSDTLCIARTGFGKSLILHSFSVLTGKITLQIVPLTKLGEEQFEDIKKLPRTSPCFLNSESMKEQSKIIDQISKGDYTHILLGLEQAASPKFKDALKSSDLQSRIGLIVIDECYLIV